MCSADSATRSGASGTVILTAIGLDAIALGAFLVIKFAADPLILWVALGGIVLVFGAVHLFLPKRRGPLHEPRVDEFHEGRRHASIGSHQPLDQNGGTTGSHAGLTLEPTLTLSCLMVIERNEIGVTLLRIGEIARRGGVRPDTLRYYERRGLVTPIARSAGGYRLYDASSVERLEFIRNAAALGLTLDEIGEILELASSGSSVCTHVRTTLRQRVEQVDVQIEALVALRRTLASMIAGDDQSDSGGTRICGIINGHVQTEGTAEDNTRG